MGVTYDASTGDGVLGASRGYRGVRGPEGGVGALGWQMDWEPNHIGPIPGLPHGRGVGASGGVEASGVLWGWQGCRGSGVSRGLGASWGIRGLARDVGGIGGR